MVPRAARPEAYPRALTAAGRLKARPGFEALLIERVAVAAYVQPKCRSITIASDLALSDAAAMVRSRVLPLLAGRIVDP
jgi:hypothetical protein